MPTMAIGSRDRASTASSFRRIPATAVIARRSCSAVSTGAAVTGRFGPSESGTVHLLHQGAGEIGFRRRIVDRRDYLRRVRCGGRRRVGPEPLQRSEEHTSELQSLMRISYAVLCLK